MLYSDTSESWKIRSRKSRMAIVSAGVLSELALAVLAILCWSFLPDGPVRSACFILATVTWVAFVFLNLSPFLRFDGYYLLSDLLDVPNLHERASALGKWFLRKKLLGLDAPCPEQFPSRRTRFLIIFAYASWLYRLLLFTAIALLVYHLFFKALGIFLFSVEMAWFVALPVWREVTAWWRLRGEFGINRRLLFTLFLLAGLLTLLAVPWHSHVYAPALLKSKAIARIYPPFSARIEKVLVKDGQLVHRGDLLFVLDSPEIEYNEKEAQNRVELLEEQLKRHISDDTYLDRTLIMQTQLSGALTRLQGQRARKKQLRITASKNGSVLDITDDLRPGRWLNDKQHLGSLIRKGVIIEGYLEEQGLENVHAGDSGRFYAESGNIEPLDCILKEIDPAGSRSLNEPYLASIYGGDVPVIRGDNGELIIQQTLYRLILTPDHLIPTPDQIIRGRVRIKGMPRSLLSRAWVRFQSVFIKEFGF